MRPVRGAFAIRVPKAHNIFVANVWSSGDGLFVGKIFVFDCNSK